MLNESQEHIWGIHQSDNEAASNASVDPCCLARAELPSRLRARGQVGRFLLSGLVHWSTPEMDSAIRTSILREFILLDKEIISRLPIQRLISDHGKCYEGNEVGG